MGYTAWDTDLSRLVDADECVKKVKGHYLCPTEACRNIGVQLCLHECDNGNHFNSMPGYADKHVEACDFPSQHSDGQGYRKLISIAYISCIVRLRIIRLITILLPITRSMIFVSTKEMLLLQKNIYASLMFPRAN